MPPNQTVSGTSRPTATGTLNAGQTLPMDWDWVDENDGGPTYMSLAASSNHPGGVNALFADGSVHFVKNSVSPVTWRALGTHRRRRGHQLRPVLIHRQDRSLRRRTAAQSASHPQEPIMRLEPAESRIVGAAACCVICWGCGPGGSGTIGRSHPRQGQGHLQGQALVRGDDQVHARRLWPGGPRHDPVRRGLHPHHTQGRGRGGRRRTSRLDR